MRFTMARPEESCHPETLLPGARTVVSAALCYWLPEPERPAGTRPPAALHVVRRATPSCAEKLDELGRRLGGGYRVLVDANQHVDREAAARSGVGFYGKNTLLITRRHGSWVVLGTLVTDVELEPTPPLELDCGECRLCIDACPTGALDEPGTLDCDPLPLLLDAGARAAAGGVPRPPRRQVYGCDICQDVCPWNRGVEKRRAGEPLPADASRTSRSPTGSRADPDELRRRYAPALRAAQRRPPAAAERAGRGGQRRRRPRARGRGRRTSRTDDDALREHAAWALARLEARSRA